MSTIISPFTLEKNQDKAITVYLALTKVNTMIREIMNDETERTGKDYTGPLDGIDSILDCLISNVHELATEFELMKYWAEDANVQIIHNRYFGREMRLEVIPYSDPALSEAA